MKALSKYLLVALTMFYASSRLNAQIKPVIPGDFADPSVIRVGNQYYAIGTSSEWAPHFPIFKSSNLKDWQQTGYVFDKAPDWTSGSFWAPEYYYHNGTYFIYYTARRRKDNVSYIGVATSKYPDRDFEDHGIIIEHGKEAIDAFVFNDNGQLYITFKAYGLDGRPIEILGSKLSADGRKLEGDLFTMLKDDKGIGLEGQSILKKDDYYYLFYSAGACCGSKCDYNVRIARSKSLQGPYENYENNPVLQENSDWKCSGHGTFVTAPNGKCYYLYHAYHKISTVYTGRQGMLAELSWPQKNGWPVFKELSGNNTKNLNIKDDFSGKVLGNYWQWDFRNSTPNAYQQKGELHLSGTVNARNPSGIAYTVRPQAINYEMSTEVLNQNSAQKGLVVYGDANAAIGIAAIGNKVEFWIVRENRRSVLSSSDLATDLAVELKLSVKPDLSIRAYWKQADMKWQELPVEKTPSIDFLPPWDRSPRVGLNFNGTANQAALFSFFELSYTK
ncbi:glycoside hydrolase family 43 protein [Pedobacter sp. GR22-6]|uniref:glycoside hydrolase family 43 protein n=1 Tax=Pedobacter sp. GR22-6 TaxID=3127957 RepID=UPI00307F37BF